MTNMRKLYVVCVRQPPGVKMCVEIYTSFCVMFCKRGKADASKFVQICESVSLIKIQFCVENSMLACKEL